MNRLLENPRERVLESKLLEVSGPGQQEVREYGGRKGISGKNCGGG